MLASAPSPPPMKAWLSGIAIYKYVCVTCKQTRKPSYVYVRINQGQKKKKKKKRKKERRIDCFPGWAEAGSCLVIWLALFFLFSFSLAHARGLAGV